MLRHLTTTATDLCNPTAQCLAIPWATMLMHLRFAPLTFLASFVAAHDVQTPLQQHGSPQFSPSSTLRIAIIGKLWHFSTLCNSAEWN